MAAVARGEAILLQGGDCAETFAQVTADSVRRKLKTLLQMAVVLTHATALPVVKVGRMAGQYAKPRSSPVERQDGLTLPSYRGDAVNGLEFTAEARTPDPARLHTMYEASARTLGLVRSLTTGGFAGLSQVHAWNRGFVASSRAGRRYEALADEIGRSLAFMRACGIDTRELGTADFYVSHEGLLLDYEAALVRTDPETGRAYAGSGHLLWIGERTRQPDGAHIEFFSRLSNPIAVKLGPAATADDALKLIDRLDPRRGRAASRSWSARAPTGCGTCCRSWSRRSTPRGRGCAGSATRCTATPPPRPAATRPAASRRCSTRCAASWRSTAPSAPTRAASTSS